MTTCPLRRTYHDAHKRNPSKRHVFTLISAQAQGRAHVAAIAVRDPKLSPHRLPASIEEMAALLPDGSPLAAAALDDGPPYLAVYVDKGDAPPPKSFKSILEEPDPLAAFLRKNGCTPSAAYAPKVHGPEPPPRLAGDPVCGPPPPPPEVTLSFGGYGGGCD